MPRLRKVHSDEPGIVRRRSGRGFSYWDPSGSRVRDPEVLERIRGLVIPPAWRDVWICLDDRGHIQARGIDAAGRRQYLYHAQWRLRRDRAKFDHMLDFARVLPSLRRAVAGDLNGGADLTRERVLACSVRLLELGFFRIGGESYAAKHEHYGLATILKAHARLEGGCTVVFDYVAKSGKRRLHAVVDDAVYEVVARLKRRRAGGPELLAYRTGRSWVDVTSADINAYLKDRSGGDFTAKDFRTWNATLLAAVQLATARPAPSHAARGRVVSRMYREVARFLGNTPAVVRSAYVDPRVVDHYEHGETIRRALETPAGPDQPMPEPIEAALIALLE
ncbi:MAG TPA: DNA topoisomerase IB [Actinomycetota bacterium]|nr:DNA topoisomerase IB [Actinomycetota bacterium]